MKTDASLNRTVILDGKLSSVYLNRDSVRLECAYNDGDREAHRIEEEGDKHQCSECGVVEPVRKLSFRAVLVSGDDPSVQAAVQVCNEAALSLLGCDMVAAQQVIEVKEVHSAAQGIMKKLYRMQVWRKHDGTILILQAHEVKHDAHVWAPTTPHQSLCHASQHAAF